MACITEPPEAGQVVVQPLVCSEMQLAGGEGALTDHFMANSLFRAVIRNPQDSLTVPGVGGGTVIDAAPWSDNDRLHEAIPLVGGGWLDVDTFNVGDDRITLGGVIASLRDQPAERAGEYGEVSWVLAPDSPWLELEGADGLWIHPSGSFDLLSEQLVHDQLVYGHDGVLDTDLGGAIRVSGASGLLVARPSEASEALFSQPVSGTAADASTILFLQGETILGQIPVEDDQFSGRAPEGTEVLVAEGVARGRSLPVPPGESLEIDLGARGWVDLALEWAAPPRPVAITYEADDGRTATVISPADGGRIGVGAGGVTITISGGPDLQPVSRRVTILPEETARLGLTLEPAFDPGDRILAALGWRGDVARSWRGTDAQALLQAWSIGARFVVTAPEDEIGTANGAVTGLPTLLQIDGSRTVSDQGWSIVSWPWSSSSSFAGHGAVDPTGRSAADLLAAAAGGPNTNRRTVVDLAWFDAAPAPWEADPHPHYVRLDHPGLEAPEDAWQAWLGWLDGGYLVTPVGDLTWLDVADAAAPTEADALAGLAAGATVATTGPLVVLRWAGASHGEVIDPTRLPDGEVALTITGLETTHTVALLSDLGRLTEWAVEPPGATLRYRLDSAEPGWLAAAAWDPDASWAMTGPVWREAPVGEVSPTAP